MSRGDVDGSGPFGRDRSVVNGPEPIAPFLKWPGGKRWAAPVIASVVRAALTGTYFEPFLGGGAIFFYLRPRRAVLGDINADLVNTYVMVRDRPSAVIRRLKGLVVGKKDYHRIRQWEPRSLVLRAARFLYLNRTAFGGIYRLNRSGKFNVPYGGGQRTPRVLWEKDLVRKAAQALAQVEIGRADFESVMQRAGCGDVVYCDPTYTVAHDINGFVRYNDRNFSWADQIRLARAAKRAFDRGATVIISNAHHPSVKELYLKADARTLGRSSLVSPNPDKRRKVSEYLFIFEPRPVPVTTPPERAAAQPANRHRAS